MLFCQGAIGRNPPAGSFAVLRGPSTGDQVAVLATANSNVFTAANGVRYRC